MQCLMFFSIFFNNFTEEERADCFTSFVFLLYVVVGILYLFLRMSLIGLQCVIGVFPDVFFPNH